MIIENWNFWDSLYMSVITLATVGFSETNPLSFTGRIHTMFVIVTGVGLFSSMLVYLSSFIIEGKIEKIFLKKAMENKIKKLNEHYIICGYGRSGYHACNQLREKGFLNFIVIEKSEEAIKEAEEQGILVCHGDATDDDVLIKAGIENAKGIICALTDDTLNVFITLSAKVLNPQINIIARADKTKSIEKLKRAGAHTIIAPYEISGRRMANAVTDPLILDFLDTLLHDQDFDLRLEQVQVIENSLFLREKTKYSEVREKCGAIVVSIKRVKTKNFSFPVEHEYLAGGDILICLGNKEQLDKLRSLSLKK